MKLCTDPKWEQTRTFLLELVWQAAVGKLSDRNARTNFIIHLRDIGYLPDPDDWKTIDNLKSDARLGLILGTNIGLRRSYRNSWQSSISQVALIVSPAFELVEMGRGYFPRDWKNRWEKCGGILYEGRMIALKNDPIWRAISAFPFPFPPFDFDDGMSVIPISRSEAVSFGLITSDAEISIEDVPEPSLLYYFDALPDGKFPSVLPPEYGNEEETEEDEEETSSVPYVESKFMKVAQVGTMIRDRSAISREEGNELLIKLAEAVTEGLENQPEWLARAYRYTGEIYFNWQEFERAFEYYGYALQFDPKVGVKKQYNKLGKLLGKTPDSNLSP